MAGRPIKYLFLDEKMDAIRRQKREWYHRNKDKIDKIKAKRPSKEAIEMKKFSGYYMMRLTDQEDFRLRFSKNITQRCIQLKKKHPLLEYRIVFFCDEANEATYNIAEWIMTKESKFPTDYFIEETLNN
jgi:hypothetical protein